MDEPFAISYIGHKNNGECKVSTELYYANDLQDCFEHAREVVKQLFPNGKKDFVIVNSDASETYSTVDDLKMKTVKLN